MLNSAAVIKGVLKTRLGDKFAYLSFSENLLKHLDIALFNIHGQGKRFRKRNDCLSS